MKAIAARLRNTGRKSSVCRASASPISAAVAGRSSTTTSTKAIIGPSAAPAKAPRQPGDAIAGIEDAADPAGFGVAQAPIALEFRQQRREAGEAEHAQYGGDAEHGDEGARRAQQRRRLARRAHRSDVDRMAFDRERGLLDRLGQPRMCMAGAGGILGAR